MSASEKLRERIEEMKKEGLEDIRITRYENCGLTLEQFCQQALDILDAESVDHVPGLFKSKDKIQTF